MIDPGPADEAHLEAVRAAGRGSRRHRRRPAHPLARRPLRRRADARAPPCCSARSERATRPRASRAPARRGRLAVAVDPERVGPFEVLPTPGHATDHVCFLLGKVGFCGDLVLGHGSSFVPPDGGSLAAYLDSLERLRARDLELLCPGPRPLDRGSGGQDRRVPRAPPDARAQAAGRARGGRALARAPAGPGLGRRAAASCGPPRRWSCRRTSRSSRRRAGCRTDISRLSASPALVSRAVLRVAGMRAGGLAKRFGLAGAAFAALAGTTAAGLWYQLFRRPLPRIKGRLRLDGLEQRGRDRARPLGSAPHPRRDQARPVVRRGLLPRAGPPLAARPLPPDRLRAAGRDRRSPRGSRPTASCGPWACGAPPSARPRRFEPELRRRSTRSAPG